MSTLPHGVTDRDIDYGLAGPCRCCYEWEQRAEAAEQVREILELDADDHEQLGRLLDTFTVPEPLGGYGPGCEKCARDD